jgi:hypothetical protein
MWPYNVLFSKHIQWFSEFWFIVESWYNYGYSASYLIKIGWVINKLWIKNIPESGEKSACSVPEKSRGMATLIKYLESYSIDLTNFWSICSKSLFIADVAIFIFCLLTHMAVKLLAFMFTFYKIIFVRTFHIYSYFDGNEWHKLFKLSIIVNSHLSWISFTSRCYKISDQCGENSIQKR